MTPVLRQRFFRIFAVFFVIVAPFLAIFSLGYDVDLNRRALTNTLAINIETVPRNVQLYDNGRQIARGSGEFQAKDNQVIPLEIRSNGYKTEKFGLYAKPGENSTARISNLWLLPDEPVTLEKFENAQPLSILSDNALLYNRNSQTYVQLYSFGGLQGGPELVVKPPDLQIKTGRWDILLEDMFWNREQKLLLFRLNNTWRILDLQTLPFEVQTVAKLVERSVIILDKNKGLWEFSLDNANLVFLENNIDGLAFTNSPDSIWLWKASNIYRIERGPLNGILDLAPSLYSTKSDLGILTLLNDQDNFQVKSLFQGILVRIGGNAFYIPDYDKLQWQAISNDARVLGTDGNTVFWLDGQRRLFSYNLFLREFQSFGRIDVEGAWQDLAISYYFTWRRILVYSPNQVRAVWYDKEILNRSLVDYQPVDWIAGAACHQEIIDRFEFCLKDNQLIAYRNTNLW
jgi:hypothetical protein